MALDVATSASNSVWILVKEKHHESMMGVFGWYWTFTAWHHQNLWYNHPNSRYHHISSSISWYFICKTFGWWLSNSKFTLISSYHQAVNHNIIIPGIIKSAQAVTVWDLHVGAEVDILGRMTTLPGNLGWAGMNN